MIRLRIAALVAAVACDSSPPPPVASPREDVKPSPVAVADAREPALRELVTELDPALAKPLDAALDAHVAKIGVGVVLIVARDGKIVYERAAGFADREAKIAMRVDTQFRLASMTKPIVSAAALALVDRGKLALDDRVTKWLPDFRPRLADGREPAITVRHLLTHTAGLGYKFREPEDGPLHKANVSDGLAEPGLAMAENLKRIASVPLLFEPGTKWSYSLAVDVLGAVVAKAGGAPLPEVVGELITRPLAMTDTVFVATDRARVAWPYAEDTGKPPVRMTEPYDRKRNGGRSVRYSPGRIFDAASFPSGGAGMAGTARDYLRFIEALRTGGGKILRPETARTMTQNQAGTLEVDPGEGFGFGVGVVLDPAIAKTAWGKGSFAWAGIYGTTFWVDPEDRLAVVLLTNVAGPLPDSEVEKVLYAR